GRVERVVHRGLELPRRRPGPPRALLPLVLAGEVREPLVEPPQCLLALLDRLGAVVGAERPAEVVADEVEPSRAVGLRGRIAGRPERLDRIPQPPTCPSPTGPRAAPPRRH